MGHARHTQSSLVFFVPHAHPIDWLIVSLCNIDINISEQGESIHEASNK